MRYALPKKEYALRIILLASFKSLAPVRIRVFCLFGLREALLLLQDSFSPQGDTKLII